MQDGGRPILYWGFARLILGFRCACGSEPTFAYVVGGIACVLGIVTAFLDGLIFYISLSVLILLIVLVIRLMARYDKRKKELETKGFESPTEEELLAYQEAVDYFAYRQSRIPSGGGI